MRNSIIVLICLLFSLPAFSQGNQEKVWQLSGLVIDKGAGEAISYVKIQINHSRRGIVSNGQGFFSIPVVESDTVFFLRLGYRPSYLVMKDYLSSYQGEKNSPYIYSIAYMRQDTITLATVTIHPFDTPEKLRTAMLAMNTPKFSEEQFARENMDPAILDDYIATLPKDVEERVNVGRQIYYDEYQKRNLMPTATLFDPVAVYRLLRYISQKAKKNRDKNLNYWED